MIKIFYDLKKVLLLCGILILSVSKSKTPLLSYVVKENSTFTIGFRKNQSKRLIKILRKTFENTSMTIEQDKTSRKYQLIFVPLETAFIAQIKIIMSYIGTRDMKFSYESDKKIETGNNRSLVEFMNNALQKSHLNTMALLKINKVDKGMSEELLQGINQYLSTFHEWFMECKKEYKNHSIDNSSSCTQNDTAKKINLFNAHTKDSLPYAIKTHKAIGKVLNVMLKESGQIKHFDKLEDMDYTDFNKQVVEKIAKMKNMGKEEILLRIGDGINQFTQKIIDSDISAYVCQEGLNKIQENLITCEIDIIDFPESSLYKSIIEVAEKPLIVSSGVVTGILFWKKPWKRFKKDKTTDINEESQDKTTDIKQESQDKKSTSI